MFIMSVNKTKKKRFICVFIIFQISLKFIVFILNYFPDILENCINLDLIN